MLELRNSKVTELPRVGKRKRFAIDGFIGAVQMLDPVYGWIDIKPRLERIGDVAYVRDAPYDANVNLLTGAREFYPDKYDHTKYIKLPAIDLFRSLTKTIVSQPTQLDGSLLASKIAMPTSYGSVNFQFTNTGMYLPLNLNSAPKVASKSIDRLTLNIDSTFDIQKLIDSKAGLGILHGYIRDATGIFHQLEWSYKSGQLELGFDLTGLKFPVTLMDAIDIDIAAGADDAYTESLYETSRLTEGGLSLDGTDRYYQTFLRFIDVAIAASDTVDHAYIALRAYQNPASSSSLRIIGLAESNAGALTTDYATMIGRTETTAYVDWTAGAWDWNGVYGYLTDAQDIAAIITEIKGLVGWATGNALVIKVKNLTQSVVRSAASYETGGGYEVPHFHADITAGGGETYECSVTDGLAGGETMSPQRVMGVSVTEALSGGDVQVSPLTISPILSDISKLSEVLATNLIGNSALTDGAKLSDTLAHFLSINKSLSDGVKLSDETALLTGYVLSLTETAKLSESIASQLSAQNSVIEGVSLADLVIGQRIYQNSLDDAVSVGDLCALVAGTIYNESFQDILNAGDSRAHTLTRNPSVTDILKMREGAQDSIFEYCPDSGWVVIGLDSYGAYIWVAQSFTPLISHYITKLKLRMYRRGYPNTVDIYITDTDVNGHSTLIPLCSGTIDGNSVNAVPNYSGYYYIQMTSSYYLIAGHLYAIAYRARYGNSSNYIAVVGRSSSPYPRGVVHKTYSGGSTWYDGSYNNYDLDFEDIGFVPHPFSNISAQSLLSDEATLGSSKSIFLSSYHALTDAVKAGDLPVIYLVIAKALSDIFKVSDSLASLVSANPSVIDSLVAGDAASGKIILNALVADGMKLSDAIIMLGRILHITSMVSQYRTIQSITKQYRSLDNIPTQHRKIDLTTEG